VWFKHNLHGTNVTAIIKLSHLLYINLAYLHVHITTITKQLLETCQSLTAT